MISALREVIRARRSRACSIEVIHEEERRLRETPERCGMTTRGLIAESWRATPLAPTRMTYQTCKRDFQRGAANASAHPYFSASADGYTVSDSPSASNAASAIAQRPAGSVSFQAPRGLTGSV